MDVMLIEMSNRAGFLGMSRKDMMADIAKFAEGQKGITPDELKAKVEDAGPCLEKLRPALVD